MELTIIQKEMLLALINLSRQKKVPVKGEEIAEMIDRNPGTVRNQMQALKALNLIEGVPGPKGGYLPTSKAFEALGMKEMEVEVTVPIMSKGEIVPGATVDEINFTTIRHPDQCQARVRVLGDIRKLDIGDSIQIGPTPVNKFIIRGKIIGREDADNLIICNISDMISLPKKSIKEYLKRPLITINANLPLREAAGILMENQIRGAPVVEEGNITGIISFKDIGRVLAAGKISATVKEVMSTKVVMVDGDTPFYEAVKIIDAQKTDCIIITSGGKPIGTISRKDILSQVITI
ncbi:MAG: CBS domain-containing protein [Halobacteria archaeon]